MCYLKEGAQEVAQSVIQSWADAVIDAVKTVLGAVGTFWVRIPSPDAAGTPAVARLQQDLQWYALAAMVLGILLCAGRMAMTSRGEHGLEAVKMLARVILVSGAAMAGLTLATKAGDAFAEWVLDRSLNADFDQSLSQSVAVTAMGSIAPALTIVMGIFMVLGAGLMLAMMVVRWIALVLLMGFWPLAAALSTTEQGQQWYRKINGWIIAFLLLKPVSAVVYAAGFLLLSGGGATPGEGSGAAAMSVLAGGVCLAMAGLTLPALLKLVAPPAAGAAGPSGSSVAGGMVATGAAVAGLAAGGAGAGAAAGGSSAGASASGSGPSGASATAGSTGSAGSSSGGGPGGLSGGGPSTGGDSGESGPAGGSSGAAGSSTSGAGGAGSGAESGPAEASGMDSAGPSGASGRSPGPSGPPGGGSRGSSGDDDGDESDGPTGAEGGKR